MEQAEEENQNEVAVVPDSGTLAWCGYLLVAGSVAAGWAGLADEPGPALSSFALLLLGVTFISLAMIAPAKLKTV
ncbi:hypothetical protein PR202_ga14643 [Eleusine coracana subsp. coracana]|uniref:Uncharacterized protein n=1 Tax=Eleusine coracana subsp. coracana TaxID=191504 RepID=A0AAV5CI74_ELECO|nr:hypothetical protein PR202_ga14643 [Eleusine coracana subsp. coracana]